MKAIRRGHTRNHTEITPYWIFHIFKSIHQNAQLIYVLLDSPLYLWAAEHMWNSKKKKKTSKIEKHRSVRSKQILDPKYLKLPCKAQTRFRSAPPFTHRSIQTATISCDHHIVTWSPDTGPTVRCGGSWRSHAAAARISGRPDARLPLAVAGPGKETLPHCPPRSCNSTGPWLALESFSNFGYYCFVVHQNSKFDLLFLKFYL